jgi:integrase
LLVQGGDYRHATADGRLERRVQAVGLRAADAVLAADLPRGADLAVDPKDAMVILGHSSIAVTLGIYTHGDEDSRRDALTRLDQLLSQARRTAANGQPNAAVAVISAATKANPENAGGS